MPRRKTRRNVLCMLLAGLFWLGTAATWVDGFGYDSGAESLFAADHLRVDAASSDAAARVTLESRPVFVGHGLVPDAAGHGVASRFLRSRTAEGAAAVASPQPPTRRLYARARHCSDGDPPA